jgi:hypothetical protein
VANLHDHTPRVVVANFICWYHAGYSFRGITEDTLFMASCQILFSYVHDHAHQELSWLTCMHQRVVMTNMHTHTKRVVVTDMHTHTQRVVVTNMHAQARRVVVANLHKHTQQELSWLTCTHKLKELS